MRKVVVVALLFLIGTAFAVPTVDLSFIDGGRITGDLKNAVINGSHVYNLPSGTGTTRLPADNISAGTFGSTTGYGNYVFDKGSILFFKNASSKDVASINGVYSDGSPDSEFYTKFFIMNPSDVYANAPFFVDPETYSTKMVFVTITDNLTTNNFQVNGNVIGLQQSALSLTLPFANVTGFGLSISLPAENITSGTLADARLSQNVTKYGASIPQSALSLTLPFSNVTGFGLSISLPAENITSGTLDDLRLSANVTKYGATIPQSALSLTLPAANITAGTFGVGNYAITGNLNVGSLMSAQFITGNSENLTTSLALKNSSQPTTVTGQVILHNFQVQGIDRLEADSSMTANGCDVINRDSCIIVKNTQGSQVVIGQAVYVDGAAGQIPTAKLAQSNSLTTLPVLGLVANTTLANNNFGYIMNKGILSNVDTSAWTAGTVLYVNATVAGALTSTRPSYPNYANRVGTVLTSNANTGQILVEVAPFVGGFESGTTQTNFTVNGIVTATAVSITGNFSMGNCETFKGTTYNYSKCFTATNITETFGVFPL